MTLQITAGLLTLLSVASGQQSSADAIVVRISGASIPSTVTLSTSGGSSVPGQTVTIPIVLSLGGAIAPGSLQIDLSFNPAKLTFVSANGLSSSVVAAGEVRFATDETNPNGMASGVVGYATFKLADSFGTAATTVALVNCMSADPSGNPLSTGCMAGAIGLFTCNVTGGASAGVADVQALINEALGVVAAVHDMNRDRVVDVADVQKVVSAAMGNGCVY